MTLNDLIRLAENRLRALNNRLCILEAEGDIDAIAKLNLELDNTEATLNQLKGLK